MMASKQLPLLRHQRLVPQIRTSLRGARTTTRLALSSVAGRHGTRETDDNVFDACAATALLTAAAALVGVSRADNNEQGHGRSSASPAPPIGLSVNLFSTSTKCDVAASPPMPMRGTGRTSSNRRMPFARNVMLHRRRSIRARHMAEKYKVDWRTVLGEGSYGSVHPARLVATNEKVALKKISKRYTTSSSFQTETDALLRIYDNGGHPNISGLRDMYEDYSHFYLILDLVSGGEMFDHLIKYGAYSEADAARLMQEVASALAFLHGVGVVHADLKPENLLLCSKNKGDGTIKLIDFGCAVVSHDNYVDDEEEELYDGEELTRSKRTATDDFDLPSTGTTAYWPPERFQKTAVPGPWTDMWSLGVILFIMLTGVHPFDVEGMSTDEEIQERIKLDPSPPCTPELTSHLSPSAVDLIQKLMAKEPSERLTADMMLQHPWITGETAATSKMTDSDKKLSRFVELRTKLAAGIFALLVDQGNRHATLSEAKLPDEYDLTKGTVSTGGKTSNTAPTHILKRAFEIFDKEGKGFVTETDLGRVMTKVTGTELSVSDRRDMLAAAKKMPVDQTSSPTTTSPFGLSLSDFAELFSRLKHKHYPRGHVIYHAGDEGDAMYFINSGKVEVKTRKGQLVSILRHGDFFGEGSLLEERNHRFTTAKCATPVDVIKIKKKEFERYIASSTQTKKNLKLKWKARTLAQAKNLIRLQTNIKARSLEKGDVVYKEGDVGESMFLVDETKGGELEVKHGNRVVHYYSGGDSFGESSLLFKRPRSSTVTCVSDACLIHEMLGADFLAMVESSPETAAALRDMCRKRLFKRAVKAYLLATNHGLSNDELVKAFHDADKKKSGFLSLDEVREIMHRMEPDFPEKEIVSLLEFLDVDGDGQVGLDEFKRVFRCFEYLQTNQKDN